MSIATYSFLPYLRQGIANSLKNSGGARGVFTVKLDVQGEGKTAPVDEKKIEIYGPGDILGIDPRAIVKTDPHDWITNFEPNYLAYIDFYDEDFPWRYTPVAPAGHRLNPWIALVVLAADEFDEGKNIQNRPLPFFKLKAAQTKKLFPDKDQLWAWAHVHVNSDLTASDTTILVEDANGVNAALNKLQGLLDANSAVAYSRLVCPRQLQPDVAYHAFVIPAYESGRLAGTGKEATAIAAAGLKIAWEGSDLEFPYYYRWKFNTGTIGDFEYLVRLLQPKVADSRVGRREMDMTRPGSNLQWIEDNTNDLGGILRLGGALKVPKESLNEDETKKTEKFDAWATKKYPVLPPFQTQLAGFLNLANDYTIVPADMANANAKTHSKLPIDPNLNADPLITPPIYGHWHALVERVLAERDGTRIDHNYNWLNELNLDPRFRVPAHFGTRVVQDNQEDFMQAAWEQIGEALKANYQIRFGQVAVSASSMLHAKHFAAANDVSAAGMMLLTAPLHKRVLFENATVFHTLRQSILPNTVLSAPMRRIARPRGRLSQHLQKQLGPGEAFRLETIVSKISMGELLPAPPKTIPPGLPQVDAVVNELEPTGIPDFLKEWLRRFRWFKYTPLVLALLILLLSVLLGPAGVLLVAGFAAASGLVYVWRLFSTWSKELRIAGSVRPENQTPESVDALPKSTDFRLVAPGEHVTPTIGATDGPDAQRFKDSLRDMFRLLQFSRAESLRVEPARPLSIPAVSKSMLDKIHPEKTIPAWVRQYVFLPDWIKSQLSEDFVEVMGYPKINKAMYEPLKKISAELFLPNINLIEHNSITLLETNQKFIESYMVGLNHEFARELLWREYPTDQMGSYFRQFWDVRSILKDPKLDGETEEKKREPYYDIPKLHEWKRDSKLGSHDHRQKPGEPPREEVVLVIRGELLKKYPTAVIYAHKADWATNKQTGKPDLNQARTLFMADEGNKEKPSTEIVRTPLYEAKADPDIYFFGFDLTVKEARGESEPQTPVKDNAGWFFVIKERPGEPRFGLDTRTTDGSVQKLVTWNDLDWNKVVKNNEGAIDVIHLPAPLKLPDHPVSFPDNEEDQYKDDHQVKWNNSIDAANLAYILYQVPMMVCVHASEMLLKKN